VIVATRDVGVEGRYSKVVQDDFAKMEESGVHKSEIPKAVTTVSCWYGMVWYWYSRGQVRG